MRYAHLNLTACHTASIIIALAVIVAGAHAEIRVDSDFPGGSGVVEQIDQEHAVVRLLPTDYPGHGWRCWWYVKLSGLTPGRSLTLDVGNAPWATPDRAAVSTDAGKTWTQTAPGKRSGKRIRYVLEPTSDSLLVAWGPPFVPADARRLVRRLAAALGEAHEFSLCTTREHRPTPALRITAATRSLAPTATAPPLVWVQARQHAWESGASWICRGFAEWVVSDDPQAVALRQSTEIVIVPIMDIDNVYRGAGGKNQAPHDHNRDWSAKPHWRSVAAAQSALKQAADARRLAAFIDLHNPSAQDKQPYFYLPPVDLLTDAGQENIDQFLALAKANITGPLRFSGRTIESGPQYDPAMWKFISKNWVAHLGTPAVAVTLETAWNTSNSTTQGYMTVGAQLGRTLARYIPTANR